MWINIEAIGSTLLAAILTFGIQAVMLMAVGWVLSALWKAIKWILKKIADT